MHLSNYKNLFNGVQTNLERRPELFMITLKSCGACLRDSRWKYSLLNNDIVVLTSIPTYMNAYQQ